LGRYQEAQQEVFEEISLKFSNKEGCLIDSLDNLKLNTAFILEQFRYMLTSYATVDRTIIKDFKIGNITLHKGAHVLPIICGPYHVEENFNDAKKFDIHRHSEETIKNLGNRNNLLPFSIGIRACPGRYVAMYNIQLALVSYLEKFQFKDTANVDTYDFVQGDSYFSKTYFMKVKLRE
jgi:cytochrome P450